MYSWISVLILTPVNAFFWYWLGHKDGKREGWIAGRSLLRVPLKNER